MEIIYGNMLRISCTQLQCENTVWKSCVEIVYGHLAWIQHGSNVWKSCMDIMYGNPLGKPCMEILHENRVWNFVWKLYGNCVGK